MYTRREKQKPFRPSASYQALDIPLAKFVHPDIIDAHDDNRVKRPSKIPDFSSMIDAETGEQLKYTNAKWSAKEGRLNLTARTILDMGTGKLDIKNRHLHSSSIQKSEIVSPSPSVSSQDKYRDRHPLVDQFLRDGPLSPMYHVLWNPLSNSVSDPNIDKYGLLTEGDLPNNDDESSGVRTWSSMDENSVLSCASSFLYSRPVARVTTEATQFTSPQSKTGTNKNALQEADRFPLPIDLELANTKNWEALFAKTYSDLIALATSLERNKFLTNQAPYPGGLLAIRRICKSLATLRVNQMREMVQAIDDEADRDQKRETSERAVFDQPQQLQDLKKQHREQRRLGKQYIDALKRDQEIVFLIKFREAGFLW